jgi:hypothetical protein
VERFTLQFESDAAPVQSENLNRKWPLRRNFLGANALEQLSETVGGAASDSFNMFARRRFSPSNHFLFRFSGEF